MHTFLLEALNCDQALVLGLHWPGPLVLHSCRSFSLLPRVSLAVVPQASMLGFPPFCSTLVPCDISPTPQLQLPVTSSLLLPRPLRVPSWVSHGSHKQHGHTEHFTFSCVFHWWLSPCHAQSPRQDPSITQITSLFISSKPVPLAWLVVRVS